MMEKCEYFKDLILTDYIDGELDKSGVERLEGHLSECSDCYSFLKEVKNNVAYQVSPQPVPTDLWDTIRQGIEYKEQRTSSFADFITQLKGWMVFPRLLPVFASFILMLLVGSVELNTIHLQQVQATDQGEYLISLLSSTSPSSQGDSNEGGTPIEHYFL